MKNRAFLHHELIQFFAVMELIDVVLVGCTVSEREPHGRSLPFHIREAVSRKGVAETSVTAAEGFLDRTPPVSLSRQLTIAANEFI